MQSTVCLLGMVLISGCSSMTVLERDWRDAAAISEINERAEIQEAKGQLYGSAVEFEAQRRLSIARDSVTYRLRNSDYVANTPLVDIRQISFGDDGSQGMALGTLVGGLVGGTALGLAAMSGNDCESDECWFTDRQMFGGGFLVGGLLGAVLGGIVGATTGSKGVIYRFRPDTPQQMSVVVGVRPSMARGALATALRGE